jgi:hypothetical protein
MQGQMPSDSACIASSFTLGIKRTHHAPKYNGFNLHDNLDFPLICLFSQILELQNSPLPCKPLDSLTCLLSLPLLLDKVRNHKLPPQCLN